MTRAIIEGIHEVELEVTPEFQKGWPKPEVYQRTQVGTDEKGHARYRVVYRWPNAAIATGLEIYKFEGHDGYELNVWAPGSTIKSGDWAAAMGSIRKNRDYPGGIFVYVESNEDPLFREVMAGSEMDRFAGYQTINDVSPGEDPVTDHFLGYEAKPASEQPEVPGPTGETGPTWGVPLSHDMKLVVSNRPWLHVTHPLADVTESNPVMVLTKHLPFDVATQDKKRAVQDKFEELEFQTFWSPKLEAWRIWPDEGQHMHEFSMQVGFMVNRIDELIDAAEDAAAEGRV